MNSLSPIATSGSANRLCARSMPISTGACWPPPSLGRSSRSAVAPAISKPSRRTRSAATFCSAPWLDLVATRNDCRLPDRILLQRRDVRRAPSHRASRAGRCARPSRVLRTWRPPHPVRAGDYAAQRIVLSAVSCRAGRHVGRSPDGWIDFGRTRPLRFKSGNSDPSGRSIPRAARPHHCRISRCSASNGFLFWPIRCPADSSHGRCCPQPRQARCWVGMEVCAVSSDGWQHFGCLQSMKSGLSPATPLVITMTTNSTTSTFWKIFFAALAIRWAYALGIFATVGEAGLTGTDFRFASISCRGP